MQLISLTGLTLLLLTTLTAAMPPQPPIAVSEVSTPFPQPLTTTTPPPPETYNVTHTASNGHPWPYHGMDLGLVKRDAEGVYGYYECKDEFWKGPCHWTQIFKGESKCHNQYYGPLGSFGPDPGVTCTVYSIKDCVALSSWKAGFKYPGTRQCEGNSFMKSGGYLQECPLSYLCTVDT